MKLRKTIVLVSIFSVFACFFLTNYTLAVTKESFENVKEEILETKDELKQALKKHASLIAEIENLESKMAEDMKSLEETDQKLGKNAENLSKQIVFLYKERYSIFTIFFSSKSIEDFATNLDFFVRLTRQEAECIEALKQSQNEIEKRIEALEKDVDKKKTLLNELKLLRKKLETELKNKQNLSQELGREWARQQEKARNLLSQKNKIPLPATGNYEEGWASWYRIRGLTAAHRTLPFGTKVKVTNLVNGKEVIITIKDRGPYVKVRIIDLSDSAFEKICPLRKGLCYVRIEVI